MFGFGIPVCLGLRSGAGVIAASPASLGRASFHQEAVCSGRSRFMTARPLLDTPLSSVAVSTNSTSVPTMADSARSYFCSGPSQISTMLSLCQESVGSSNVQGIDVVAKPIDRTAASLISIILGTQRQSPFANVHSGADSRQSRAAS